MQRVSYLMYKVRAVAAVSYERAPAIEWENELGRFTVAEETLRIDFKTDFSNFEDAQAAVGQVLSAWETKAALERGPGEFQFIGAGGAMEETLLGKQCGENHGYTHVLLASDTLHATATCNGNIVRSTYLSSPANFLDTAEVRELVQRWNQSRQNREPAQSAANYILTRIEQTYGNGNRDRASTSLNLHRDVLRKLGELCATRGDVFTARKASASTSPLTRMKGPG